MKMLEQRSKEQSHGKVRTLFNSDMKYFSDNFKTDEVFIEPKKEILSSENNVTKHKSNPSDDMYSLECCISNYEWYKKGKYQQSDLSKTLCPQSTEMCLGFRDICDLGSKENESKSIKTFYKKSWEALKDITHYELKDFNKDKLIEKKDLGNNSVENYYLDRLPELDWSECEESTNESGSNYSSCEEEELSKKLCVKPNMLTNQENKGPIQFELNDTISKSSHIVSIDPNDPELRMFADEVGIDIDDNRKPNRIFRLDHLTPSFVEDPPVPNGNILGGHYGFASEFQLKEKYSTKTFDFLFNVVKDYAVFLQEHPDGDYPSVSELMVRSDQKLSVEESEKARYYDDKYLRMHSNKRDGPLTAKNSKTFPLKISTDVDISDSEWSESGKETEKNPKLIEALNNSRLIKMKQNDEKCFGFYASSFESDRTDVELSDYDFSEKEGSIRSGPLTQDEVNHARKTGVVNLCHRSLVDVPERIWSLDMITEEDRKACGEIYEIPVHPNLWWTFKPLISLNLSYNSLTMFYPQGSALTSLKELRATNNMLEELPEEIGNLKNLTFLDLSTNSLKTLPPSFSCLQKLEELILKRNFLNFLPETFGNLVSLKKLDLSFNKIVKLPNTVVNLKSMEILNLSFNKLSGLLEKFNNLQYLEVLDVSYNKLADLPVMQSMPKLIVVNAACNSIHQFPNFSGCKMLTELRLDGNNIESVVIQNLKDCPLIQFTMSNNKVVAIPDDIYKVSTLVLIDFSNNCLMWLPWSLARLKYLTIINVDSNNISNVEKSVLDAGSKKIINVLKEKLIMYEGDEFPLEPKKNRGAYNCVDTERKKYSINVLGKLSKIDKAEINATHSLVCKNMELFELPLILVQEAKVSRVHKVDLSDNNFNYVPVGLKILAPYLTELILKENYLKTIPDFIGRMNLMILDVSFNCLDSFPLSLGSSKLQKLIANNNCFSTIPKVIYLIQSLENINFEGNRITEIDGDRLKNLVNLSYINFNNNSIEKLPKNLSCLPNLKTLEVSNNLFKKPGSDVLRKGTEAILNYLSNKTVKQ